ncbi:MAG TPA: glycosyltransferase family 4 protein, partial [Candidatus Eremiobacteraceae bacterium]|nr:glycosyltransferase family 4 protein [Candidatus Eremiobacteraceae bacterium]
TELALALGEAGLNATLVFVGDPDKPAVEAWAKNVELRRWCQWISKYHPSGVYDGEQGKIDDFTQSAPPFIVSDIVKPSQRRGERVLVLAEDWQVAPAMLHLDRALQEAGLRQHAVLAWNANNTYGFDTIDWAALANAAHITCVSRYMKFELGLVGVQALVVPNGVPAGLLELSNESDVKTLERALRGRKTLLKVGRYDPDKRWLQAIDAVANLRGAGADVQLIVRGGKEPYGQTIFDRARARGLSITDLTLTESTPDQLAQAIGDEGADVVNLKSFLPNETLYALYAAVDAVLANSGKEPFGLVGLEVMACGGIPVCGSTGEDYARPFENAVVCDTGDPAELAAYLEQLFEDPRLARRIRKRAAKTARKYTWPNVFDLLDLKLGFLEAR